LTINKGAGIYFHPISDKVVQQFGKKGKTIETITTKPHTEEAVLYLLLDIFGEELPQDTVNYLQSLKSNKTITVAETIKETIKESMTDETTGETKEIEKIVSKVVEKQIQVDTTQLLDMIGATHDLLETIENMRAKKERYSLIIGEDCIYNPQSQNIAKLCGLIDRYTSFDVVIIPPQTNSLGVSLICDLDTKAGDNIVGYNEKAGFELSALGDGDIDMPTLLQQEGTFTNIDKTVVPTNCALPYDGWVLNDIANKLGVQESLTINYTAKLPTNKGFDSIKFDQLHNFYGNDRQSYRGYFIKSFETNYSDTVEPITPNDTTNDTVYMANPIDQFNEFTAKSQNLQDKSGMYVSKDFLEHRALKHNDKVQITANGATVDINIYQDDKISGDIGYISVFEKNSPNKTLFSSSRYSKFKIKKV
jgi:NADH-quinone oxidoreductase subunit G